MPHVVGLTASIVSKSLKTSKGSHKCIDHVLECFAREIKEVEKALDATVITTKYLSDILKYVTQPDESFRTYQPPPKSFLDEIIENGLKKLSHICEKETKKFEINMNLDRVSTKIRIKEAEDTFKNFQRIVKQTIDTLTVCTMYNFHDSTDIYLNPSFLPFCTQKAP